MLYVKSEEQLAMFLQKRCSMMFNFIACKLGIKKIYMPAFFFWGGGGEGGCACTLLRLELVKISL